MDRKQIDDELLIERYLLGRLPEAEAREFELRFMADQDLLDDIEATDRLMHGLRTVRRTQRDEAPANTAATVWTRRIAVAASVLFTVSAAMTGMLYMNNSRLTDALQSAQRPQANTLIVDLVRERGDADSVREVTLPAQPGFVVLTLDAGVPEGGSYRASLASGGTVVAETDGLHADTFGYLVWSVHSRVLQPGAEYELAVRPAAGDGALATYHFAATAGAH